jgi:hypothetical protein
MICRKFFLLLSGFILMLHAVLPHSHGSSADGSLTIGATQNAGFLQQCLQFNPGPEHLESFHAQDAVHHELCEAASMVWHPPVVLLSVAHTFESKVFFPDNAFAPELHSHRGPPLV